MARKSLKKKSETWECEHGCDISTSICKHMERKLPQVDRGRSSKQMRDALRVHQDVSAEDPAEYERKCRVLEKKLRTVFVGNENFRINLIMDRVASHMSLKEIADKYGYVSAEVVRYLLKQSEDLLRTSGVIQKLKE